MVQGSLFKDVQVHGKIVNVASVPHRSPFRYPGGKTWLVPRVRQWLTKSPVRPREFIEPFAGGGIIGLTVAFETLAEHVTMVELDSGVAAVWKVILDGGAKWLANRIATFDLTIEAVRVELSVPAQDIRGLAFQTLLRNRVNHGGILAPGSGLIRYGENGKGIGSRWYPATLQKRILDIDIVKDKITFIEGDGLAVMRSLCSRSDTVFFIDPPYTASGKRAGVRLYEHNEIDHEELFAICQTLAGDFLMTYDNNCDIAAMAYKFGFDALEIPMKNTHHAEMTELLIGRDLNWARA